MIGDRVVGNLRAGSEAHTTVWGRADEGKHRVTENTEEDQLWRGKNWKFIVGMQVLGRIVIEFPLAEKSI